MTDKVQKILSEIATRKLCTMDEHMAFYNDKAKEDYGLLSEIEDFIKDSQEEPVCEDLEETARRYAVLQAGMKDAMTSEFYEEYPYSPNDVNAFKVGAKWQEKKDQDAVEIARKEVIDKLRKWIANKNERDSFTFGYIDRHFDELLKQAMKDE